MSYVPSIAIRFICHIPSAMCGISTLGLYKDVKGLENVFDVIPNGHRFLQGLKIVGHAGTATFAWNMLMFIGSMACQGYLLAIVGLLDLVLASLLILGAVYETSFMPKTYSQCGGAADWKNGTDGTNFFVSISTEEFSPKQKCDEYVRAFILTCVVIAFYLICGSLNILIGLLTEDGTDGCVGTVFSAIGYVLKPIFFPVINTIPSIRFGSGYATKVFRRSWRPKKSGKTGYVLNEKSPKLKNVKTLPEDVVRQIMETLHYSDAVNVRRSSKYMQMRFFGPDRYLQSLRPYCCQDKTKSQCEICDGQICIDCSGTINMAASLASEHLKKCRPYCTKCYYNDYCRHKSRYTRVKRKHESYCGLGDKKWDLETGPRNPERKVCLNCLALGSKQRSKIVESQDKAEIHRLVKHPLACEMCKGVLPSRGPRWWICDGCKGECRSNHHPSWVNR